LPTYEVFINDKPRKIELAKIGEKAFTAKVDDKPVRAELADDKLDLEKVFLIKIGDKKYQVELPRITFEGLFQVKVEEATFKAEVRSQARTQSLMAFEPVSSSASTKRTTISRQVAEGAVTAPITGKILSVKAKKGDQVKAGQVLCIIEAMKMENEIAAPKAGTVREVYVSDGSSVSEGEVLMIVD
jgi:biotin carboxyl carrier protein